MASLASIHDEIGKLIAKGALLRQTEENRNDILNKATILGLQYHFIGLDGQVPAYSGLDVRIWVFGGRIDGRVTMASRVSSQAIALGKKTPARNELDEAGLYHFGVDYDTLEQLLQRFGETKKGDYQIRCGSPSSVIAFVQYLESLWRKQEESRSAAGIAMQIKSRHLYYEWDMLQGTAAILIRAGSPQMDADSVIRNALIESFCIHFRGLYHFFCDLKPRGNDIVAGDFLEGRQWSPPEPTPFLKEQKTRVDREIAHLTTDRFEEPRDKTWDFVKIVAEIEGWVQSFCGKARPEWLDDRWRRIPPNPSGFSPFSTGDTGATSYPT